MRGKSRKLNPILRSVSGSFAFASGLENWRSSDETVASVDSEGKVTAVRAGIAEISVSSGGQTATCTVQVTPKADFAGDRTLRSQWTAPTLTKVPKFAGPPVQLDANGDGKLDLVIGRTEAGLEPTMATFLGDGKGGFTRGPERSLFARNHSIVVGDINHDQFPDLAVAEGGLTTSWVRLLTGDANGAFTQVTNVMPARDIRVDTSLLLDLDLDGLTDVVAGGPDFATNQRLATLSVSRQSAFGFLPAVKIATVGKTPGLNLAGGFAPTSEVTLASGDFNEDGYPDIAVSNFDRNQVDLLINSHDGLHFQVVATNIPSDQFLIVGDLDGDSHLDLVTDELAVAYGRGDATFDPVQRLSILDRRPYNVGVGDVTQDGKPDIVFEYLDTVVWENLGSRTFAAPKPLCLQGGTGRIRQTGLCSGDFDGDGKDDLVLQFNYSDGDPYYYEGSALAGLMSTRMPSFLLNGLYEKMEGVDSISAAVDFDGDSRIDFAWRDYRGIAFRIYQAFSTGVYSASHSQTIEMGGTGLQADDVNEDAIPDFLLRSFNAAPLSLLTSQVSNYLQSNILNALDYSLSETIDIDGDGHLDLVTQEAGSFLVKFKLGRGDGTFAQEGTIDLGLTESIRSLQAFNLNGDRYNDFRVQLGGEVRLYEGFGVTRGPVLKQTFVSPTGQGYLQFTKMLDLNGDGMDDLLLQEGEKLYVYINSAGDLQQAETLDFFGAYVRDAVAADMDDDGTTDLVVSGTDVTGVYQGDAGGTHLPAEFFALDLSNLGVSDIDQDGLLDVTACADRAGAFRIHTSFQRKPIRPDR